MSDTEKKERKPKGYWNIYEHCYNVALECTTRSEFKKKYQLAYNYSKKNNWLDKFTWFISSKMKDGYWDNYDHCYEAALKCKSRSEFKKKYYQGWYVSNKNGWINDFNWFNCTFNNYTDKVHFVYAYIFTDNNTVYVGRTNNLKERHYAHTNKDCPLKRYSKMYNIEIPEMTILEKKLTLEDSLIFEDLYLTQYINDGWNVINTAKTGLYSGSKGGIRRKWTKNACYKVALKCKTRTEFQLKFCSAYQCARENGWLDDYYWFVEGKKPNGFWKDYNNCIEEAKKYTSRGEFAINNGSAYKACCKNGIIDIVFPKVAA